MGPAPHDTGRDPARLTLTGIALPADPPAKYDVPDRLDRARVALAESAGPEGPGEVR